MTESENNEYDNLLRELRQTIRRIAKEWIPKLCYALQRSDPRLTNEDIRETVKRDLILDWSRTTVYEHIPDEFKDKIKQEAARQSHKNVIEVSATENGTVIATSNDGTSINSKDDDYETIKLERGRFAELLTEERQKVKEMAEAISKNPNKDVLQSKEFQAQKAELAIAYERITELEQLVSTHMKQNPSQTFQPASTLGPGMEALVAATGASIASIPKEIEFPARDLSTFFLDSKNAKQVMYLKIDANAKVVSWESDYKREKKS